jgi:hypothetical protein
MPLNEVPELLQHKLRHFDEHKHAEPILKEK